MFHWLDGAREREKRGEKFDPNAPDARGGDGAEGVTAVRSVRLQPDRRRGKFDATHINHRPRYRRARDGCDAMRAHHAFASEFDARKPVKFTGTVTKMEWINPHSWMHVEVKKPDGTVETG